MIYMLLADGFEEIEALTPLDMLRRVGAPIQTVSITDQRTVHGAHGIDVLADLCAREATETPSMLIFPGGMPGTRHLDASPVTDTMLQRTVSGGGHVAAICAAPLILGKRGLLEGKRAVCYPGFEDDLRGATVCQEGVVTDGRITTATGMGVAVLFGAELVRLIKGSACAEELLLALRYTGFQRETGKLS